MITVRLPSPLSERIGSHGETLVHGSDIYECLIALTKQYPDLEKIIWPDSPDRKVNPAIIIFHKNEQIRENEMNKKVSDGDQIDVIPAISGG